MTKELSIKKETATSDSHVEGIESDARFLHPTKENMGVQSENPTDAEEDCPIHEHGFVRNWGLLQESNLSEKLGMAFELLDMGLSEEAVERILHVNLDSREKRL